MFAGLRALGWSVTSLEAISAARGAASGVYGIIDAVSNRNKYNYKTMADRGQNLDSLTF